MAELRNDDRFPHVRKLLTRQVRPSRRVLWLLITPLIAMVIASNVGDALTTTLADTHPLVLLALNARNRILVLVTNELDVFAYYSVATVRLLLPDPLFFLLGLLYGDAAVSWVERRSPTYGPMLRQVEGIFGKAAYPLVFIAPNNYICLFAGAAGMHPIAFLAINISGTFTRLFVIRQVGNVFDAPIDRVLGFFGEYRIPLLVISIVLVVGTLWHDRRKGRSEIDALARLNTDVDPDPNPTPDEP